MNDLGSPQISNQRRYLTVAVTCSAAPIIVIALLPEPLRSSMLPIVAVFAANVFLYGLALLLVGLEWMWKLARGPASVGIRCPACHTCEEPHRRFFVSRVRPQIMRIHCPECHERWVERR